MRRLIACGAVLLIGAFVMAQDGPLTDGANLPVRTDSNGYLLLAAQTYSGPDGPRRPLANTLVRTDANGYLIVTNPSGIGAPTDAQYWVGAAHAGLSAEKNLGALSTGLVINTAGVPSAYGGSSCTNQFVRSLNASGSATCNSVSLTADVTGDLPYANLAQGSALSVLGVTGNATADNASIAAASDHQVLRRSGASVAFGAVNLAQSNAVTGTLGPGNLYTETTVTTTGNIDDLSFSNANIIRMNNASDATIRGLAAGTAGQVVSIVSIGAGKVFLAHQNTNSSAANRLINFATTANTPLAAGVGSASYQYDATTQRWRLIDHEQGPFINDTSATYTASGSMTVTVESGDISLWSYYLKGRTLYIRFSLVDFTIGGTPSSTIEGTIPGGFTNSLAVHSVYQLKNTTCCAAGHVFSSSSATTLGLRKIDDSNYSTGTNNNDALGQIMLSVN